MPQSLQRARPAELQSPAPTSASARRAPRSVSAACAPLALYTREERVRRDGTRWTLVQGLLAPIQFVIFVVSLVLVLRYLSIGAGHDAAVVSVVVKTFALYAIMITGSIWEKVVFGRYLFAPMFFWEDVFSMLVLALHTAYLAALAFGWLADRSLMLLALAAYASYIVNAVQFIVKLRAARRGGFRDETPTASPDLRCAA